MVLQTLFVTTLSFIEFFVFVTHLLVHLGVRNTRYNFLRKQGYYFAVDGFMTLINLIYFWDSYYYFRAILIYAIVVHFYYVVDIYAFGGLSRIFQWSCITFTENRFELKYLKENLETIIDCSCHGTATVMFMRLLDMKLQVSALVLGFVLLYKLCLGSKFFFSEKHMMPSYLKPFFSDEKKEYSK